MKIPKKRTKLISFRVTEQVKRQWDALQLYAKRSDDDLNLVIANGIAAMLRAAAKQLNIDISKTLPASAPASAINGVSRD